MDRQHAIIIGGGPAGLTAAYELNKHGKSSVILEADHQVGGISKTVNYNGNRFDIGGHRFFSKIAYVNELWEEIMEDDLLVRDRMSRIHYKGHFFDYPLKPLNALSGLGVTESLGVLFSYAKKKLLDDKVEPQNFEQWVVNQFGYRLYDIFFKTYTEKVWGMSCKDISADWASQRIKDFSLKDAVRGAFLNSGKKKNGEAITTLIDRFKYPRLGPGMMWEQCQNILERNGSPTLLQERVAVVKHANRKVEEVVSRNHLGEKTSHVGDQFISSMPLRELIFALDPLPPKKILDAAAQLRYRDYLTVVLVVNKKEVFPDNWIYIHTPAVKLGRIQNYKNWSPDMVANPSQTTLGLEYFLWEKDDEWKWSDERLIELGVSECTQIGIIKKEDVVDATVVRMKKAYPVYDHSYVDNLAVIRKYLGRFKNLQTIGRNGLHRYNNQDHSMLTAVYAARNIFGSQYDVWSVNTEMEYHENEKQNEYTPDRLVPIIAS